MNISLLACLAAGCAVEEGVDIKPDTLEDLNGPSGAVMCLPDASRDVGSAFTGTFGKELRDTFCPRRDRDFWRVATQEPQQIVHAVLVYKKMSNMRLAMRWLDGQGQQLSEVTETGKQATTHRLETYLPAYRQGEYTLEVLDQREQTEDSDTPYSLTLMALEEPDAQEPNNSQDTATSIHCKGNTDCRNNGEEIQGYLATVDDVDWYKIDHNVGSNPVVTVELRWPDGSKLDPTWQLVTAVNGDTKIIESAKMLRTGSGKAARKVRATTLVTRVGASLWVKVFHPTGQNMFDVEVPYGLKVAVHDDPSEQRRDDTAAKAVSMVLGAPAANPSGESRKGTLVAQNDRDWYRVDVNQNGGNSLLHVELSADDPKKAGFLLQTTLYRACKGKDCPAAAPCLDNGTCLKPWYWLPSLDGPVTDNQGEGSPQLGGHSPNHLETQVPLWNAEQDPVYIVVSHIAAAAPPLDTLPGFSRSKEYRLQLRHVIEPDGEDRDNPDNRFVARPIKPGVGRSRFYRHARRAQLGQWVSGFISYAGDQDFFHIPAPGDGIGITVTLEMERSSVDIRMTAKRGGKGVGAGATRDKEDLCAIGGCAGGCDDRNYCTRKAVSYSRGPLARSNDCVYSVRGDTIEVWVNDLLANDWDTVQSYRFKVETSVGCPSSCNEFVCGQ